MLTARGRTLVLLSVSFLVFGRLVALPEFSMAGAAFGVVLAVGAASLWLRTGGVDVRRRIWPARTVAGQDVRVELTVRGRGPLGTGPVLLADEVPPALGEPVRVALEAGTSRRARQVSYLLGPRTRGRYEIGPLQIVHTDAFGALRRVTRTLGTSPLIVYPSFETISTMPSGLQRLGAVRSSPLLGQGDEFYALRAYEEGDDLRKVHWPTSMKTGQLVVKQEELLGEPRALIILDTCAVKHRGTGAGASIEAAISACASVAVLAIERRMRIEILTPDGPLLQTRRPTRDQILEALAMLEPSGRRDLGAALATTATRRGAAVSVVITPGVERGETGTLAQLLAGSAGGALVWVVADTFSGERSGRRREPARLGLPLIALRAGDSFRRVWEGGVRNVVHAR